MLLPFAKHLTDEKKTEKFIAGKGVVTTWERVPKNKHWFDALACACVAAHLLRGSAGAGGREEKTKGQGASQASRLTVHRYNAMEGGYRRLWERT